MTKEEKIAQAKLAALEKKAASFTPENATKRLAWDEFECDGARYRVCTPALMVKDDKGDLVRITHTMVLEDKALQAKLVAIGSSMIAKI